MKAGASLDNEAEQEFHDLIARYSASHRADEQETIRQTIWERFGTKGAVFISDMANFSSTSRNKGICHFLKRIHRARIIVRPIIEAHSGLLLKCDADNCYAFFGDAGDAVRASFDINAEMFRQNQEHDLSEHIYLSVGIDYGRLLLIGNSDYFGDPVNTASKLGEDLAGKSETLITDRALETTDYTPHANAERMTARVSDIEISYVKLTMTQASIAS